MQCHFCDRAADVAVESEGVRVGVCEAHFEAQLEALADADSLRDLATTVDRVE
jgi:hypothetical protein